MMRHVPARTQERADHTRSHQESIYRAHVSVRRPFQSFSGRNIQVP